MWLPEPVYRALPGAYTLGGLAALAVVPMPLGLVSGGLLVTAGFAVWRLREKGPRPRPRWPMRVAAPTRLRK